MGIFTTGNNKLATDVAAMKQLTDQQFDQLLATFNSIKKFVWSNPDYTPQEVLTEFGTDAVKLFQLSNAVLSMLTAITGVATNVVPDNYSYVINGDGTITLTEITGE